MEPEAERPAADADRRAFLKVAGKAAVVAPPAMTLMLTTSLDSPAIAASGAASPPPSGPGLIATDPGGPITPRIDQAGGPPGEDGSTAPTLAAAAAPASAAAEAPATGPSSDSGGNRDGDAGGKTTWPGWLSAGLLALLGLKDLLDG